MELRVQVSLLVLLVALRAPSGAVHAATPVIWHELDPLVVRTAVSETVQCRVQTDGLSDSVVIELAGGGTIGLAPQGGGLFTGTLTHAQVLSGYAADDANHNFVGFLKVYQGTTLLLQGNLFIGVDDGTIPPSAVEALGADLQATPRLVNLHLPLVADPSTLNLATVAQRFYQEFPDGFDFLNIVSTPSFFGNRYHFAVRNDVVGTGVAVFNDGATYGSPSRLIGINRYPVPGFFDLAETGSLHELGHQWINYSSVPALQMGSPHWPISSLARGIMGYGTGQGLQFPYTLFPLGTGDYRLDPAPVQRSFSDMELYLMGMAAPGEVGSHFAFSNQSQTLCGGCVLAGPTVAVTAASVAAADGPRTPAYPDARRGFRVATVIVSKSRLLTPVEMSYFDHFAARGEATTPLMFSSGFVNGTTLPFALATNGRGTLSALLDRRLGQAGLDFDRDSRGDNSVYHPATGLWYMRHSSTAATFAFGYGGPGFAPLTGDFDGDHRADIAVYHGDSGLWFVRQSTTGTSFSLGFGGPGYAPVPKDYDGDGRTDIAVYHEASGLWHVRPSTTGTSYAFGYGGPGFSPVPNDYDGDGRADLAAYHPASGWWYVRSSASGVSSAFAYGGGGFDPVPRDYDGDARADAAVYHPATGLWFLRLTSTGTSISTGFGGAGYVPVPADYDRDGMADLAVYHEGSGLWFVRQSSNGASTTVSFGGSGFVALN